MALRDRLPLCALVLAMTAAPSTAAMQAGKASEAPPGKARLEQMRKAADALDYGADPAAYRKAWEEVLALGRTLYRPDDPELAALESELVTADYLQGDTKGALARAERIAARLEAGGPAFHERLVDISNAEVVILMTLGEHDRARKLAAKVLDWRLAESGGKPSSKVSAAYSNYANAEYEFGNYDKAIALVRQAIAEDRRLDPIPPAVAPHFANLPVYLLNTGRLEEATEEARAAQALFEKILPSGHPFQASNLNTLARILIQLGRPAEGEAVARKATDLAVARFGQSPQTVGYMTTLAQTLTLQGKNEEATTLATAAVDIVAKALGADADRTLAARETLAAAIVAGGDRERGMKLLAEVADARAAKLPPYHRDRVFGGDRAAVLALKLGKLEAARKAQADAQALRRATFPAGDVATLAGEARLGAIEARLGDTQGGLKRALDAAAALDRRMAEALAANSRRSARDLDIRGGYGWALDAALSASDAEAAFALAQRMMDNSAGQAAREAVARSSAASPDVAELVRQRQDAALALEAAADRQLRLAGRGAEPRQMEAADAERRTAEQNLAERTAALRARAPSLLASEALQPLSLAAAQAALGTDEALLVACVGELRTAVLAITRNSVTLAPAEAGAERIAALVARIRTGLGAEGARRGSAFDLAASGELHQLLLPPRILRTVAGRRLLIASNSALAALPFAVLAPPGRRASLASARWLVRDHALVTLPSIAAVAGPRRGGGGGAASSFVAVGAPLLAPADEGRLAFRSAELARQVRELPSLPATDAELRALGKALAGSEQQLLTGPQATEAALRKADLARASILAFATHGVGVGELDGLDEPALVLTPEGSDDGLLTASEIMRLRIGAEWVLLSACNTAGGGSGDDSALAGLGRAFLYAGGRNLLASHWAVRDDAAAFLSVETIRLYRRGLEPAEALRRAMLKMIDTRPVPAALDPANWAPFVFVGR